MSSIGAHATIFFLSRLKESITENGADQINTYYDVINISKTKKTLKMKQWLQSKILLNEVYDQKK